MLPGVSGDLCSRLRLIATQRTRSARDSMCLQICQLKVISLERLIRRSDCLGLQWQSDLMLDCVRIVLCKNVCATLFSVIWPFIAIIAIIYCERFRYCIVIVCSVHWPILLQYNITNVCCIITIVLSRRLLKTTRSAGHFGSLYFQLR